VLVLAQIYDIPKLRDLAVRKLVKETLTVRKCVEGWRNVYEARCDSMQRYLATFLGEHLQEIQGSADMLAQYSHDEAVRLMIDI
jgi:hypothetical protein